MKKGFVLLETILVISIICIVLVTLYTGYLKIINQVETAFNYDNTEYIYKTKIISLKLNAIFDENSLQNEHYIIYCNSFNDDSYPECQDVDDSTVSTLSEIMNIKGIYITIWNTYDLTTEDLQEFEPTTQRYINHLNPNSIDNAYRVIVMFEDNDKSNSQKTVYQYASLRFVPKES